MTNPEANQKFTDVVDRCIEDATIFDVHTLATGETEAAAILRAPKNVYDQYPPGFMPEDENLIVIASRSGEGRAATRRLEIIRAYASTTILEQEMAGENVTAAVSRNGETHPVGLPGYHFLMAEVKRIESAHLNAIFGQPAGPDTATPEE